MKNKLMSMTDYVLSKPSELVINEAIYPYAAIHKYANFLKQPLELGMFVPCDEEGEILLYPKPLGVPNEHFCWGSTQVKQWNEAANRVIFELNKDVYWDEDIIAAQVRCNKVIEDFIGVVGVYLTDSKAKELGLEIELKERLFE